MLQMQMLTQFHAIDGNLWILAQYGNGSLLREIGWKKCLHLPAVGEQNANFNLISRNWQEVINPSPVS